MATPAFMSSVPGPQQPAIAQPARHRLQRSHRPHGIQMAEQQDPRCGLPARGFRSESRLQHIAELALPVQFHASAQRPAHAPQPAPRNHPLRPSHRMGDSAPTSCCVRSRSAGCLRRAPASRARMGTGKSQVESASMSLSFKQYAEARASIANSTEVTGRRRPPDIP